MKTLKVLATGILALSLLSGCSNMTKREKNTAIGAGAGAAAGAVLSGGSAWGTAGGAAIGGLIGNQVTK
ncbi:MULTISPECIES: glycine zipper 2TM domain-containing protein [Gulbenkiania]|uniref:Glycine zipper 2TM domain n=2 Tax=Gulbenkiania TaxID=397456 RepID=A0A0K6H0M5_9NEIS|nr:MULTISPECIES: glycine zipper 2TM domain-containing protein [Gulbenkiania]TCW31488.1 osmotically inducible lipoprotein OsmB [Gulbenkiania mobilis]CUA84430.1 Glycine zipper 2TM domain [Gulbenkiania indica]